MSLIGLVTALVWLYGTWGLADPENLDRALRFLQFAFALLWFISVAVHLRLWRKEKLTPRAYKSLLKMDAPSALLPP